MTGRADESAIGSAVIVALLPLMGVVLVGFVLIGAAMPVLPLHVHDGLGFGPIMVGVVAGFQFASALLARLWAGGVADRHGAKRAVMLGLAGAALAGLLTGSLAAATTTTASGKTSVTKAGVLADKEGGDKHACKGKNDCKGKGGCKTGDGGCKGKNSCKGKGGCATDGTKKEHKKKEK